MCATGLRGDLRVWNDGSNKYGSQTEIPGCNWALDILVASITAQRFETVLAADGIPQVAVTAELSQMPNEHNQ
jgi:hypothetical protein